MRQEVTVGAPTRQDQQEIEVQSEVWKTSTHPVTQGDRVAARVIITPEVGSEKAAVTRDYIGEGVAIRRNTKL